jgi:hypothetical protein
MKTVCVIVATVIFALGARGAQHGTAPPGYYSPGYFGDTWTGTVTSTNNQTREITLSYTEKGKTETFTGVLQQGYKIPLKDGSSRELKPSHIPIGTRLVVYYITRTQKVNGHKTKTYEIFRITTAPDAKTN